MRRRLFLVFDVVLVFLSPFAALLVRDGAETTIAALWKLLPLAVVSACVAIAVFVVMGTHRVIWRFFSLSDVLRVMSAVTLIVMLPLGVCFAFNRLDGVARSLPVFQWLILFGVMCTLRTFARTLRQWQWSRTEARDARRTPAAPSDWVLVVGLTHWAALYLRAVDYAGERAPRIAGLLADGAALRGREVQSQKVLGSSDELSEVLRDLEVHGINVGRIVLAGPVESFTESVRAQLVRAERERAIMAQSVAEMLGLTPRSDDETGQGNLQGGVSGHVATWPAAQETANATSVHWHLYVKRGFDFLVAILLTILLAPVIVLVSLLVALDVGLPVIFWQQRPGRNGRPFKLYKFRTMRSAHDEHGNRIPDAARVSRIGHFLRQSRLDELPQLFNVLVGEMSFVGPRPLLLADLPRNPSLRWSVRPGLTGWAQVSGGRSVGPEEKAALDAWYVKNSSLWLDLKVLRRTLRVLVRGDRLDTKAMRLAFMGSKTGNGPAE